MLITILFVTNFIACGHALTCYEGLDISFGGIPLYHWAERKCKINDVCFLQEISTPVIGNEITAEVRYGGCVSLAFSEFLTCEELFGSESTLTMTTFLDIVRGLDQKLQNLIFDFMLDYNKHMTQLFSRGKDSSEFVAGIFTFMESIGLDAQNNRKEFEGFVRSAANGDIRIAGTKLIQFLDSAAVSDEHVKALYESTSMFLIQVLGTPLPSDLNAFIEHSTRIVYTISRKFEFNLAKDYDKISEELKKIIDKQALLLVKDDIANFLLYLELVHSVVGMLSQQNEYKMYNFMVKILREYKLKYPEMKAELEIREKIAEGYHSSVKTINAMFPCTGMWIDCVSIEKAVFSQQIHSAWSKKYFELAMNFTLYNNWTNEKPIDDDDLERAWADILPELNELDKIIADLQVKLYMNTGQITMGHFIDASRPTFLKIAKKLSPEVQRKMRQQLSPKSCKHYECDGYDFCNDINGWRDIGLTSFVAMIVAFITIINIRALVTA